MPENETPNSDTPADEETREAFARFTDALLDVSKKMKPAELTKAIGTISNAGTTVGKNVVGTMRGTVVQPAWQQVTKGETRWTTTIAVAAACVMQYSVPRRFTVHPHWLLPATAIVILTALLAINPGRIDRTSRALRFASLALIALISAANIYSGGKLVDALLNGHDAIVTNAPRLLFTGGSIWFTNVIVFSLWYWETDRGGPAARALARKTFPDFLFPQMQDVELAPPDWEPKFPDYLYVSFTNATAFSPTDVLPMSRWAKMTMMVQSGVSLALVALVIARAVNILR